MIAVDIGNTKTAIAFLRDTDVIGHRRIPTRDLQTPERLQFELRVLTKETESTLEDMGAIVLASVVPKATEIWTALRQDFDIHFVSPNSPLSYKIMLHQPETLGADRIADLEAAVTLFGTPVIVVDAGTATTVNVMTRSREFLGGAIAPGLILSLQALFENAARVPAVDILPPERVIGRSTEEALYSGAYYGHAALIEGLIEKMKEEIWEPEAQIVFSGGSIPHLENYLAKEIHYEPYLTLKGLGFIHHNLSKGRS